MNTLDSSDLVFSRDKNGKINAGGFDINSYLLENGEGSSYVLNTTDNKTGGGVPIANVSDMFKGLAVPAGLLYLQQNVGKKYPRTSTSDPASPDLFDRLLDYASEIPDAKKKMPTRKNKSSSRKRKPKSKGNTKSKPKGITKSKTRKTR